MYMKRKVVKKRDYSHGGKAITMPDAPKFLEKRGNVQYKEEFARTAFYLTLLGATDVQISQTLGCGTNTIDKWKHTHTEFKEALDCGKIQADGKVSHSLYLAAVGYSHPDQVVLSNKRKEYDPVTGKVLREWTEPLVVDTVKSYPPNVTAAIKWLQARQPEIWGNKLRLEGQINHTHKLDLSKFSDEELQLLKKISMRNIEDTDYEEVAGE